MRRQTVRFSGWFVVSQAADSDGAKEIARAALREAIRPVRERGRWVIWMLSEIVPEEAQDGVFYASFAGRIVVPAAETSDLTQSRAYADLRDPLNGLIVSGPGTGNWQMGPVSDLVEEDTQA